MTFLLIYLDSGLLIALFFDDHREGFDLNMVELAAVAAVWPILIVAYLVNRH